MAFPTIFAPLLIPSLGDVADAVRRFLLGTRAFTSGLLAIGTTKSKIKTAAIINYCIDGILYAKAATDDLFVFTDLTVQAVGLTRYYLLCLDAAGNASVVAGAAGPGLSPAPAGTCPVGYVKIVTDATHTFTPATTLLDAAGVTATYVNLSCAPAAALA